MKTNNKTPWIDKELICLGKKRDRVYNKARKTKQIEKWNLYKTFRDKYATQFKEKRKIYYNNFLDNNSTSTKKLWNKIQPFVNPNKTTSICPSLITKYCQRNSNPFLELSNIFVNFFSSIIKQFSFQSLNLCELYINNIFTSNDQLKNLLSRHKFSLEKFDIDEVAKELKNIDDLSSAGEIGINSKILKHCADQLAPILTELFNICIQKSEIPDEWKTSHITPIYKGSGPKSELNSYRPISVVSPIAKVFETLIAKRITYYFESNKILHDSQYGFRKGKSCEIALNTMLDQWREKIDKGSLVASIFLDLSKAFDTVDHNLLIKKLELYNFCNKTIKLVANYLSNRTIKIKIDQVMSKSEILDVGIPQGSVLGPLLFIIFINDLCYLPLNSNLTIFADDTTVYNDNKILSELMDIISRDLELIHEWLCNNRLILNLKKTHAMLLGKKNTDGSLYISCGNEKIKFISEIKLLGIIIDNKLNFSSQISNLCNRVNKKTYILNKNIRIFSINFRPILFKLFIQSLFDYCSTIFLHLNKKGDINKLEKCFNKSIYRILKIKISNLDIQTQYKELSKYRILPLFYRKFSYYICFLYRIMSRRNTILFNRINNFLKPEEVDHSRTRNAYIRPTFKTNLYKYSFSSISIQTLNITQNKFLEHNELRLKKNKKQIDIKTYVLDNIEFLYDKFKSFIT